jgi:hypothetical protein
VANWNDAKAFEHREDLLLIELRSEVTQNMKDAKYKSEAFIIVAESARRVLALTEKKGAACKHECWSVIVDLMHASQWQQIFYSWTTYDELRQDGLPTERLIIELVNQYKSISHNVAAILREEPRYRSMVRGLIPIKIQDAYWQHCFLNNGKAEIYLYPCPEPARLTINTEFLDKLINNAELMASLREWASIIKVIGEDLVGQQKMQGWAIIEAIDNYKSNN